MQSEFQGLQGIDISTACFLFNPELAFAVTNRINTELPKEAWMQLELYPFFSNPLFEAVFPLARKLQAPIPAPITVKHVRKWQKEYPHTKVARVHLPFGFDQQEIWYQAKTRTVDSPTSNIHHLVYLFFLGHALNKKGIQLARELGVAINAHANVAYRFDQAGRTAELEDGIPCLYIENSPQYGHPGKYPHIENQRVVYDPQVLVRELIGANENRRFLWGTGHTAKAGIDNSKLLNDSVIVSSLGAMHLEGPNHEVVDDKMIAMTNFLQGVAKIKTPHSVRGTFDYDPRMIQRLKDPADFLAQNRDYIMATQRR
jgi:hypothetical protein